jgi:hypothetical protein
MDPPPELLSLVWPILNPSYQPPGPAPPTIHWTPNTAYALGSVLIEPSAASAPPGLFFKYVCTRAGTSDPTTEPLWPIVGSIIDAGCTWLARENVPYAPDVVRHRAPPHREPPHVPSAAQLAIRGAFREATEAVGDMAPTEAHGWYRRSDGTGQEYWNRTAGYWIPEAYYDGAVRADWLRPNTRVTEPEWADQIPVIDLDYPDRFSFRLFFHAELDPGTYRDNSPTRWANCPYYIHDRCNFDPSGYSEYGLILTPPSDWSTYFGTIRLPTHTDANPFLSRTIRFKKQVQELDRECIVWAMEPLNHPELVTETLTAFYGPSNPWVAP